MTRGLVLVDAGFAETQVEYAYHRLREDAVLVDVASPAGGPVTGDRGGEWPTDPVGGLDDSRGYDLVVVPGGGEVERLAADASAARLVEDHLEAGGVLCAIADGVRAVAELGLLDGRLVTGGAADEAGLAEAGATTTGEAVTIDGTIVTVRDADALPYGVAAALGSVAIPQDPASQAVERPRWEGTDAA